METALIIVLVIVGLVMYQVSQKRWHNKHGGDEKKDIFDITGPSG